LVFANHTYGQLTVNAGNDTTICNGSSVILGGTPSAFGGKQPYLFRWQPVINLDFPNSENPIATNVTSNVVYTLTVVDSDSARIQKTVAVSIDEIYKFSAGKDTVFCLGQYKGIHIGSPSNLSGSWKFSWEPSTGLSDVNVISPIASPTIFTTYTLTVSDDLCGINSSQISVKPVYFSDVLKFRDTTIFEGKSITLLVTNGKYYDWSPDYFIKNKSSDSPIVSPPISTIYSVSVTDENGCKVNDIVKVNIIKEEKSLIFYSAFTPNQDSENDTFVIDKLEYYPNNTLKIYNRYGKLIYNAVNYDNSWRGTYLGEEVPAGTYFYILDDGVGNLHKGSVSILR